MSECPKKVTLHKTPQRYLPCVETNTHPTRTRYYPYLFQYNSASIVGSAPQQRDIVERGICAYEPGLEVAGLMAPERAPSRSVNNPSATKHTCTSDSSTPCLGIYGFAISSVFGNRNRLFNVDRSPFPLLAVYLAMFLCVLSPGQVSATGCSPLPNIPNANVTYVNHSSSQFQVQITCDPNHHLAGSDVIWCLPSGVWNDSAPVCQPVVCESLPTIPNGEVLHSGTEVGNSANYTCIKGFKMEGSAERVCQENATWSGTQPHCRRIVCAHPGTPIDGSAYPSDDTDYPAGTSISFSCTPGYSLNGTSTTVCSEQGSWTRPIPECLVKDCGTPPILPHAMPIYDSTILWKKVLYICDPGYTSNLNTSLTCVVNASWSGLIYPCTELPPETTTEDTTSPTDITTITTIIPSTTESFIGASTTVQATTTVSFTHPSLTSSQYASSTTPSTSSTATATPSKSTSAEEPDTTASSHETSASTHSPTFSTLDISISNLLPVTTSLTYGVTSLTSSTTQSITSPDDETSLETSDARTSATQTATTASSSVSSVSSSTGPSTIQTSSSRSTSVASVDHMSGEKLGIVIGIVIGSVLPIVLIAGMCFLCQKKRIESSKSEVYGNGQVIMGNGHDNHVTLWCDDTSPTVHVTTPTRDSKPPVDRAARNGRCECVPLSLKTLDGVPDDPGGSVIHNRTGLNGNTHIGNSNSNSNNSVLSRVTNKTAL